jgi:sensor histidine kinase YesM
MEYRNEKNMKKRYLLIFLFIVINVSLQAFHINISHFSVSFIPDKNIMCYPGDLPIDENGNLDYFPEKDDSLNWKKYSRFELYEMFHKKFMWLKIELPENKYDDPAVYIDADVNEFEVYFSQKKVYQSKSKETEIDFQSLKRHIIPLRDPDCKYVMIKIFFETPIIFKQFDEIYFGSQHDLNKIAEQEAKFMFTANIIVFLIGSLLIIIGFISLCVFLYRRKKKEHPFLTFSLFSVSAGVVYLLHSILSYMLNISPMKKLDIMVIVINLLTISLILLVKQIFSPQGKPIFKWLLGLSFVSLLVGIFSPNLFVVFITMFFIILRSQKYIESSRSNKRFIIFTFSFFLFLILISFKDFGGLPLMTLPFEIGIIWLVIAFGYFLLEHYTRINRELQQNKIKVLQLEQENLLSQLESLKKQIDPHFLFNSLGTLISLIEKDSFLAIDFVEELSKVYRYILQTQHKELVELKDELNFINSYIFLLSKRFGKNLNINLKISKGWLNYLIPPLSLQLLIENAVKHNIISKEKTLNINISIDEDEYLNVENNFQKKRTFVSSTKIGLKNLKSRYEFFTDRKVEIISDEDIFQVRIPLIKEMPERLV